MCVCAKSRYLVMFAHLFHFYKVLVMFVYMYAVRKVLVMRVCVHDLMMLARIGICIAIVDSQRHTHYQNVKNTSITTKTATQSATKDE